MTATVKTWLAQRLNQMDSVQKTVVGQGADLVVHAWSGIQIHVHLIAEVPKTRTLKRLVAEATRVGVGSLFVVDARLLPPDGARLAPPEWLMAIHSLMDDKIYTFRLTESGPRIAQVHLRMTARSDEREVWYGPDIEIGKLPFFRVWVKTGPIKGDFLVANFAADPFWHNRAYRGARAAAEEARKAERRRTSTAYEYGYGGAAGNGARPSAPAPLNRLEWCYARLGLRAGASCEDVKTAFRRLALESHPDVSALPKEEAAERFRELNEAYTYLRDHGGCG